MPRADETTPGRRTAILGAAAIQATYVGDHDRAQTLALDALRDGLPPDCPVPVPAYSALASAELSKGRPDDGAARRTDAGLHDLEAVAGDDAFNISIFHSIVAVFSTFCGDYHDRPRRGRRRTATGATGRQSFRRRRRPCGRRAGH